MIDRIVVVLKEGSCCSVGNLEMQNGLLLDRASILYYTIRIGPVYMQSARYGPASLRFGRMTSGETVFNPRRLARVIFGLARRLLHKRDARHVHGRFN